MINEKLVHQLISDQFPNWKNLAVKSVLHQGWDNRTYRLGEELLVRLPSGEQYSNQVEKEYQWLPKLAPLLPLTIPKPLALGKPSEIFPWYWSVNRWLPGESAIYSKIDDLSEFAACLAHFLKSLQKIDTTNAPRPGAQNFYRGGDLKNYDIEARKAIMCLVGKINVAKAREIWENAILTEWKGFPLWVHGDISPGNLLTQNGKLTAVIDFGQLSAGDPACDLAIAWTFFEGKSRELFRSILSLDDNTWLRARAWTLWKFMIVAAGMTQWNAAEAEMPFQIINTVIEDYIKYT